MLTTVRQQLILLLMEPRKTKQKKKGRMLNQKMRPKKL